MTEDPWEDEQTKRWVDQVLEQMAPKMRESALVMQLVPRGRGEVKFWVELGASIMMNKPILAIAFNDDIPHKLRLVADEVVILKEGVNPEGADEVAEAIKRMMEKQDGHEVR